MFSSAVDPEYRVRVAAFDSLVHHTLDALRSPTVRRGLGPLADDLRRRVESFVLPNVRHGRVSLPRDAVLTNRYAFLPDIAADRQSGGLVLDGSMLEPTLDRFHQTIARYTVAFRVPERDVEAALHALIRKVRSMSHPLPPVPYKGQLATWVLTDPSTSVEYRCRPILRSAAGRERAHPFRGAATVAHETVHGDDYEAHLTQLEYDDAFRARTELRAYHVGAVIRSAGGVLFGEGKTAQVEALRVRHTTPEAPFEPTPALIHELHALDVLSNGE